MDKLATSKQCAYSEACYQAIEGYGALSLHALINDSLSKQHEDWFSALREAEQGQQFPLVHKTWKTSKNMDFQSLVKIFCFGRKREHKFFEQLFIDYNLPKNEQEDQEDPTGFTKLAFSLTKGRNRDKHASIEDLETKYQNTTPEEAENIIEGYKEASRNIIKFLKLLPTVFQTTEAETDQKSYLDLAREELTALDAKLAIQQCYLAEIIESEQLDTTPEHLEELCRGLGLNYGNDGEKGTYFTTENKRATINSFRALLEKEKEQKAAALAAAQATAEAQNAKLRAEEQVRAAQKTAEEQVRAANIRAEEQARRANQHPAWEPAMQSMQEDKKSIFSIFKWILILLVVVFVVIGILLLSQWINNKDDASDSEKSSQSSKKDNDDSDSGTNGSIGEIGGNSDTDKDSDNGTGIGGITQTPDKGSDTDKDTETGTGIGGIAGQDAPYGAVYYGKLDKLKLYTDSEPAAVLEIIFENGDRYAYSLGWVQSAEVVLKTDKGNFFGSVTQTSLKIGQNATGHFTVRFEEFDETATVLEIQINNVLQLNNGLPTPGSVGDTVTLKPVK